MILLIPTAEEIKEHREKLGCGNRAARQDLMLNRLLENVHRIRDIDDVREFLAYQLQREDFMRRGY